MKHSFKVQSTSIFTERVTFSSGGNCKYFNSRPFHLFQDFFKLHSIFLNSTTSNQFPLKVLAVNTDQYFYWPASCTESFWNNCIIDFWTMRHEGCSCVLFSVGVQSINPLLNLCRWTSLMDRSITGITLIRSYLLSLIYTVPMENVSNFKNLKYNSTRINCDVFERVCFFKVFQTKNFLTTTH